MNAVLEQSAPALAIGTPWRFHKELASTDCEGRLHFTDLTHPAIAVAECNSCGYEHSVHKNDARRDLREPVERWWDR